MGKGGYKGKRTCHNEFLPRLTLNVHANHCARVCFVEQEAFKNDISARLKYAVTHDCETKWNQCGKLDKKYLRKGKIDRSNSAVPRKHPHAFFAYFMHVVFAFVYHYSCIIVEQVWHPRGWVVSRCAWERSWRCESTGSYVEQYVPSSCAPTPRVHTTADEHEAHLSSSACE